MVATTPVHPEGPRYAAPIVYLPGVWLAPRVWHEAAGYLAHRGWDGGIVDLDAGSGGVARRADAVAAHLAALPIPPVLVGHDAGALVALASATRIAVRALVLVAPLRPGASATHALTWSRGLVWSLLRRRPVPPPGGRTADAFLAGAPPALRQLLRSEDPRLLSELARRSPIVRPPHMPPTLVLHGALRPAPAARRGAGASPTGSVPSARTYPTGAHWLLAAAAWQRAGDRVHRWLVQRLGEPLLELYAEAMADRGADELSRCYFGLEERVQPALDSSPVPAQRPSRSSSPGDARAACTARIRCSRSPVSKSGCVGMPWRSM